MGLLLSGAVQPLEAAETGGGYRIAYIGSTACLARPAATKQQHGGLYVLLLFLSFIDLAQTNYLNMYGTDLRQIHPNYGCK